MFQVSKAREAALLGEHVDDLHESVDVAAAGHPKDTSQARARAAIVAGNAYPMSPLAREWVAGGQSARGSPVKVSGALAADILKRRLRDSSPRHSRPPLLCDVESALMSPKSPKVSGASAANILKQRLRDSSPTLSRGEGPTVSQRTASESEVSQVEPILPPSNVSTLTKPGTVCATNPHPVL